MSDVKILRSLYESKQHDVTTRWRDNKHYAKKKFLFNNKMLGGIIKNQPQGSDLYITKYPKHGAISTIILDFDNDDLHDSAYRDVCQAYNYLKYKKLNCVIVNSGNKGYHLYIQTQPMSFCLENSEYDMNKLFNIYTDLLLGDGEFEFPTLDQINSKAGLNGNIRLLFSTHPLTGNKCEIVKGEFLDLNDDEVVDNYYQKSMNHPYVCHEAAVEVYKAQIDREKEAKQRAIEAAKKYQLHGYGDPIQENDLRIEIPRIFGGSVKDHGDYIMVNCFEHNDSNPSMVVKKDYYFCKSCGAKGNIWSLIKKGYIQIKPNLLKSKKLKGDNQ